MKRPLLSQKIINRRTFLRSSFLLGASSAFGLNNCHRNNAQTLKIESLEGLLEPDVNGVMLPKGLRSRVIARSGIAVAEGDYLWHGAPDGGACFSSEQGWIYVSNSELGEAQGGVSAIQFNTQGEVLSAYSILSGSSNNCSGGAMPWGTWLSCEESGDSGRVFECDPLGVQEAEERPALGRFNHEAVAYDAQTQYLYLTEDRADGGLYRFIASSQLANGCPDISEGELQIALFEKNEADEDILTWQTVPDPLAINEPTRYQVSDVAKFNGGEGICYFQEIVYFTTKNDNRVWAYDTTNNQIVTIYDAADSFPPVLTGVDNITITPAGQLLVAEDGGDMQLVLMNASGKAKPLLQIIGQDQSEITGPAFSPDGSRLYFSYQRGASGEKEGGITYEISGFA